jgi:adenylate cyclase
MAEQGEHRRLAAIFAADMVSYSRLMEADERGTIARQKAHRTELIDPKIAEHHGRIVKLMGDGMLVEFASVVDAVECAIEVQRAMVEREADVREERRIQYRVGVNLGDIVIEGEDIFGDGVNIAARLQEIAEPGGICISGTAYDQLKQTVEAGYQYLGDRQVKNIEKPVRVYRVLLDPAAAGKVIGERRTVRAIWRLPATIPAAALLLAVFAGVGAWQAGLFAPTTLKDSPQTAPAVEDDSILALPTGPSIAVLPFVNLSADPEQEYFADGFTDQLITELTRFRELRVIARNTVFQFKGQAVDVREVGRALSVRYVIEGSVRRSTDTIRVNVQVIDTQDGSHLWAEAYEENLMSKNLFELQDDIIAKVAAMLAQPYGVIPTKETLARVDLDIVVDAYECTLKAYQYYQVLSVKEHASIRACLEEAVDKEPAFSDAWAHLTWFHMFERLFGYNPRPQLYDAYDRMLADARNAVNADPRSAFAYQALATAHFYRHETNKFFEAAKKAIKLNPNHTELLAEMGQYMAFLGRWDEGIALLKKAIALDPYHPGWYHHALFYDEYRKDNYRAALTEIEKMNMPDWYWYQMMRAAVHGQLGNHEKAGKALEALRNLYPDITLSAAQQEQEKYNISGPAAEQFLDGLRKAGLDMPKEPAD